MLYTILTRKIIQVTEPTSMTSSSTYVSNDNYFYIDINSDKAIKGSELKNRIKSKLSLTNVLSENLCISGLTASLRDGSLVSNNFLDYTVTVN